MAQKFNGEIINADSRQVYRYMDIGTAKPSAAEMALAPHHLFNLIDPDEDFSLAQYQSIACECIRSVQERGCIPFLVGGSGQYLWGVLEGWQIPRIPPDPELRKQMENIARENGIDVLYEQLREIDPVSAQKIDKRNVRRVIRALEVTRQTQVPVSRRLLKQPPDFTSLIIGLTAGRAYLYQRVDSRVDQMIQHGLVSEVEELCQLGYGPDLPSMNSIGYKQIGKALRKEITLEEAVRQIKVDNHRFVRHQYAWFRLEDERIHWFNIETPVESEIMQLLSDFLKTP
jgi:tRNA dimethylallyltransferase